jgi:putative N6-adenine-specific DNA methylase
MPPPVLDCYAITPPGVEALTAGELASLGIAPNATEPGGVSFRATLAQVVIANLELRTASRVLVRVATFHASAFHELERRAARLPWEAYLPAGAGIAFRVTSRKSKIYHQDGITERLAGAAARRVPGVQLSRDDEAQRFVVRLFRDDCTVSVDASGAHLHQRGYRLATAKAPLRETLAAAMLLAVCWNGAVPLVDPLCGSGTIPIEAALLARRVPPGLRRGFALERWPSFNPAELRAAVARAEERMLARAPLPIVGADRDAGAIEAAAGNAARAGVPEDITFRRAPISALEPPPGPGVIVTNPPYGVRVGRSRDLRDLYARLGQVLRRRCPGWRVALLSARAELAAQTGLDLSTALSTTNGGIRVRLLTGSVPAAA